MTDFIRNILPSLVAGVILMPVPWLLSKVLSKTRRREQIGDPTRRKGRQAFLMGCCGLFGVLLWNEVLGTRYFAYSHQEATIALVRRPRWIAYEPLGADPSQSKYSDIDSIAKELELIRKGGFDGIITFTSRGHLVHVPRLAKQQQFKVIMGVWEPRDRQEIEAAISQAQYVDAYCLGHDGLDRNESYSHEELAKAIDQVRFRTGRPVSTSEKLDHYFTDESLLAMGDWLFPDCLLPMRDDATHSYVADARRDAKQTIDLANRLAAMKTGKPILLKMVGYPVRNPCDSGVPDAEQKTFFDLLNDAVFDVGSPLSSDVRISVYSAFDLPWKSDPTRFYPWERCTGLFNDNGHPRDAVPEIMRRIR